MNFIGRRSCFIPCPELFLLIQSFYSGSKVTIPDPKFLLWIQSYYSKSKVYYSGFKVFTLNTKLLLRIQSFYCGSKVFTPDPKLKQLCRINEIHVGWIKTLDPKQKSLF